MNAPVIPSTVEVGTNSYLDSMPDAAVQKNPDIGTRENFLNILFSNNQRLMSSASHNMMMQNSFLSERYQEQMKMFQPAKLENAAFSEKADLDKKETSTSASVDYASSLTKELELQTMNQLVFSVSLRFGSSVNQLVRGT